MTVMATEAVDLLTAAKRLIEDPARWTRGAWARNCLGHHTEPGQPDAVRWCVAGACIKVIGPSPSGQAWRQVISALQSTTLSRGGYADLVVPRRFDTGMEVGYLNDTHDHADALALLDEAIAYAANLPDPEDD